MKQHAIICVGILFAAITFSAQAQDYIHKPLFSFEVFQEHVSKASIPGFTMPPELENLEDEGEFMAAYVAGNDVFMIKIETRWNTPWDTPPYHVDGKAAEFYIFNELAMLMIDLPELNSILTVGSNKIKNKTDLEEIARQTGFLQLEPTTVSWPGLIPEEYRIEGTLIEASEGEDFDTGIFSYQVHVTLVMSPLLKQSLYDLMEKYDGSEEMFVKFPDGTILNFPFHSIDEIDGYYAKDSWIKFVYYIP